MSLFFKSTLIKASILALACVAAFPALAATPIDQTRPLDPRGRVEIDNLKGRVEVRAWDRPEVKITGSLGAGVEKFSVEGDRGALHIEVKYPNRARDTEPTVLIVQVPLQAELEVSTVSATIDVHGVAPREPDAGMALGVLDEAVDRRGLRRPAGDAAMEADRHDARMGSALLVHAVEGELQVVEEIVRRKDAGHGPVAPVIAVHGIGDDQPALALDLDEIGKVVVVGVGIVDEAALLGDDRLGA